MFLTLKDLAGLFRDKKGIQDDMLFYTVSDQATATQPKGLFVPTTEDSGELLEAIANGAIAAIWEYEKKLPRYVPSQFPIFFTNNQAESLRDILTLYTEKLNGETSKDMEITNFQLSRKTLLNKNYQTYDIAGSLDKLVNKLNGKERRE